MSSSNQIITSDSSSRASEMSLQRPSLRDRLKDRVGSLFGPTGRKGLVALCDQGVVSVTNFTTTVLISRMCGAEGLGVYTLGMGFVMLIGGVQMALVTTPYIVYSNRLQGKESSEYSGSSLVQCILLGLASMFVLAAVACVASLGVGPKDLDHVLWVLIGVVPFFLLREFCRRYMFAHMRMGHALLLDMVASVVQLGGLATLAASGNLTAPRAYLTIGLSGCITGIVWFVGNRSNITVQRDNMTSALRRNWRFGRWALADRLNSVIYDYMMPWFLALMLSTSETGKYAACVTILMISNPLMLGLENILGPRTARAFTEGKSPELRRIVWKTTRLTFSVMFVFCGTMAVIGSWLLQIIYQNPDYADQGTTIAILATTFLMSTLCSSVDNGLRAMERPDVIFKFGVLSVAVTALSASIFVGEWGTAGAALSCLCGTTFHVIGVWVIFNRLTKVSETEGERI